MFASRTWLRHPLIWVAVVGAALMGALMVSSYIGGSLIDAIDLAPDVIARCFPMAASVLARA